jgi:hypothetical protein
MQRLAELMAILSGFVLTGYHGSVLNTLATSVAINLSLCPLTAVVAFRRGRSALLWSVLGLLFGAWALVAALLFLPSAARKARSDPDPRFPTSDAA